VSGHLGFFDAHVFKCVSNGVREATSAACRRRCEARQAKMRDGVDDRIDVRLSRLEPSPEGTIMSVCLSLFATGFAWGHLQVLSTAIDACVLIDSDDGAALLRLARSIGQTCQCLQFLKIQAGVEFRSVLKDDMLAAMAGRAVSVEMIDCTDVTDAGIQTLHRCRVLKLWRCPQITHGGLRQLIADHELTNVVVQTTDTDLKQWLQRHLDIVRVCIFG
jgi:hypothetical protein